ncbi:MAG: methyltransferase domain-containing protein [Planctomycetota bacterium]|nr:MAG: methyltransferase domain-containing protein [Planctomycetota bacterium]
MRSDHALRPVRRAVRMGDLAARRRARNRMRRRRRLRALLQLIRHTLAMRNSVTVDGVRYTEREPTTLARALGPQGTGMKEYFVRFPDGSAMRIRCEPSRVYADLMEDPRLRAYEPALERVRPGMRVLEIGAGTGAGSDRLAWAVGPSGAVVALEDDAESVRFARRRYPTPHLAVERGGSESLHGELDGSFDAAVVRCSPAFDQSAAAELARCIAPGGWVLFWDLSDSQGLMDLASFASVFRNWEQERLAADSVLVRKPAPARDSGSSRSNLA